MNIDSEKLLEWRAEQLCDFGERFDLRAPELATAVVLLDALYDAIHSGELTPKRVYARAPEEGCRSYIKPGKLYEVRNQDPGLPNVFEIEDDEGCICDCRWEVCKHLNGANWGRVEK